MFNDACRVFQLERRTRKLHWKLDFYLNDKLCIVTNFSHFMCGTLIIFKGVFWIVCRRFWLPSKDKLVEISAGKQDLPLSGLTYTPVLSKTDGENSILPCCNSLVNNSYNIFWKTYGSTDYAWLVCRYVRGSWNSYDKTLGNAIHWPRNESCRLGRRKLRSIFWCNNLYCRIIVLTENISTIAARKPLKKCAFLG